MATDDVTPIPVAGHPIIFRQTKAAVITDDSHPSDASGRMSSLRKDGHFIDLILQSSESAVPCHRVVVSAGSQTLCELVQSAEDAELPVTLQLAGIHPQVLELLVHYLYTSTVDLTTENVQAVSLASRRLGLTGLHKLCDRFMSDLPAPANCLGLLMFARQQDLPLTQATAKECALTRLTEVLLHALPTEYEVLNEEVLVEVLSSQDIVVESEDVMFEFAVAWIRADRRVREPRAADVLGHVHLQYCTPNFLLNTVEQCPYLRTDEGQQRINEANLFIHVPRLRHTLSRGASPRRYRRHEYQLMALGGRHLSNITMTTLWYLHEASHSWKELSQLPGQLLYHFQVCAVGCRLIVSGGSTCLSMVKATNCVWEYTMGDLRGWHALAPMMKPRAHHAMVAVGEEVFVIGGCASSSGRSLNILSSVEKLGLTSNSTWRMVEGLDEARCRHIAVNYQEYIFVLGGVGEDGTEVYSTLMYDVGADTWRTKSAMPYSCDRGCAAVHNDIIYVIGEYPQHMMCYDPAKDDWSVLQGPGLQATYPCSVVWQGKLLVGGGRADTDTDTCYSDTEVYDCDTDQWSDWQPAFPTELHVQALLPVRPHAPATN